MASEALNERFEDLQRQRDELRVQIHLASAEARDRWEERENRWRETGRNWTRRPWTQARPAARY